MNKTPTVIWQMTPVRPWVLRSCWVLLALVGVVPAVLDGSGGNLLTNALVYSLVWGIPVWIALLTLYSVNYYGRITVTPSTLRVGRDAGPIADLDPAWLSAQSVAKPSMTARMQSLGVLDESARPTLLGGAYDIPLGANAVRLRRSDGNVVVVACGDPAGLIGAIWTAGRSSA